MAFNIGAILGTLVLDSSKWDNSIKGAKADMKSFEGAILRNERVTKRFGIALGVAGAAITAVNVKMIKMAAAAEESENLFEVSMGGMADSAREWSKGLSDSLGLNQFEIRRTVGLMDVMLKSMGLSEQAAYGMSTSLVQLSQDMASFYNLNPDEAFQKIQAGITGETEPLKRLGIIVNETTVKQWALTKGIIKQGQELTEQQKVLARYGVILESTKQAQGDLARTIGSTTNQARVFSSRIQEIAVTLGNALLPMVNEALKVLNSFLTLVKQFTEKFPNLTAALVTFTAAMGLAAIAVGGFLIVLPGLTAAALAMETTVVGAFGAIALNVTLVAAAIAAFVYAVEKLGGMRAVFWAFGEAANQVLSDIAKGFSKVYGLMAKIPLLGKVYQPIADGLSNVSKALAETAEYSHNQMIKSLAEHEDLAEKFKQKSKEAADGVKEGFSGMWDGVLEESKKFHDTSSKDNMKWLQKIKDNFNVFEEMGKRTFNTMADSFSNLFYDSVMGELTSLQEAFASFGRSVIRIITDIIAQWVAMKIMTGIAGAFTGGTAAVAGVGGYGAGTPTGAMDMGSYTKLPSYDVGTDYVPYDMIAKVHKGEKITPASENGGGVVQLTIQNAITTEAVAKAMESRAGQKTIVNVIRADSSMNGVTKREVQTR